MKNKDRPSLQIYQPGKRRTNSTSTPGDETGENRGAITPENESSGNQFGNSEKPSSSKNGDRKRSEPKESSKGQSDDRKKPANEKRISRYSEKRNKAKLKSNDLTDNPIAANDCNSNDGEKNNDWSWNYCRCKWIAIRTQPYWIKKKMQRWIPSCFFLFTFTRAFQKEFRFHVSITCRSQFEWKSMTSNSAISWPESLGK